MEASLIAYANQLHDPSYKRIESLKILYNDLNDNELFKSLNDIKKLGMIVGVERGILNLAIEDSSKTIAIPSWSSISFTTSYSVRIQFVCDMIKQYPLLIAKLVSQEIEWDKLCRIDIYNI